MNQSNVIFFYLFAAFIVFITMRGELPVYLGFLLATPKQSSTSLNVTKTAATTGEPGSGITTEQAVKFAMEAAPYFLV